MTKYLTRFSTYTLLVALAISAVAEFYSIVGLTAIFAAAVVPTIIMGVVLGLGKITATVWLKLNWDRAPLTYKLYLIPAVITLMFLTSIGCFGFLSKAHSDQSLVSGDVQSKIAIYDEKIKTAKDNIEANRRALKQMDEAVDQSMARSNDEKGADKAVAIRRGQQKERQRLQSEIAAEQKSISALSEERAPIAAEVRKVEAEVGPIRYLAAMIYGDTTNENMLEAAVRWVIVIIVAVFDPLALMLLLAAQQSFRWDRQREQEQSEASEKITTDDFKSDRELSEFAEHSRLIAQELDRQAEQQSIDEANALLAEIEPEPQEFVVDLSEHKVEVIDLPVQDDADQRITELDITELDSSVIIEIDEVAESPEQSIIEQHPYLSQPFVHFNNTTPVVYTREEPVETTSIVHDAEPQIEQRNSTFDEFFLANSASKEVESWTQPFQNAVSDDFFSGGEVADDGVDEAKFLEDFDANLTKGHETESPILTLGVDDVERPGDYLATNSSSDTITVDSTNVEDTIQDIDEHVTENVTTEKVMYSLDQGHITFEGKRMSVENLKSIRPDLVIPPDGNIPTRIDYGSEFPKLSLSGDTFIRIDSIPHRVYKFNGKKWMNVDKVENTTYLTNRAYIRYLIQKLELNEYDTELLTYAEQDEVETYLVNKKNNTKNI